MCGSISHCRLASRSLCLAWSFLLWVGWMDASRAEAQAQLEVGCCAFTVSSGAPARRCADLTRSQCDALRPHATFFRGQRCDTRRQRCLLAMGTVPVASPTPTATATATAARPTPTPTPDVAGCCEVAASRAIPFPICGNEVSRGRCLAEFGFRAAFCEQCRCSSHDGPGFLLAPGGCVTLTPTPTRTPTRTPPAQRTRRTPPVTGSTPTPTATPAVGCCEVPVSQGRAFCGNRISRETCLGQFPGAVFCPECHCSSHTGDGFGTTNGQCIRPLPRPRPPRVPLGPRTPRR